MHTNTQVPVTPDPQTKAERLRKRYLDGSLDAVLIPEEPKMDELVADLFPDLDHTPPSR